MGNWTKKTKTGFNSWKTSRPFKEGPDTTSQSYGGPSYRESYIQKGTKTYKRTTERVGNLTKTTMVRTDAGKGVRKSKGLKTVSYKSNRTRRNREPTPILDFICAIFIGIPLLVLLAWWGLYEFHIWFMGLF